MHLNAAAISKYQHRKFGAKTHPSPMIGGNLIWTSAIVLAGISAFVPVHLLNDHRRRLPLSEDSINILQEANISPSARPSHVLRILLAPPNTAVASPTFTESETQMPKNAWLQTLHARATAAAKGAEVASVTPQNETGPGIESHDPKGSLRKAGPLDRATDARSMTAAHASPVAAPHHATPNLRTAMARQSQHHSVFVSRDTVPTVGYGSADPGSEELKAASAMASRLLDERSADPTTPALTTSSDHTDISKSGKRAIVSPRQTLQGVEFEVATQVNGAKAGRLKVLISGADMDHPEYVTENFSVRLADVLTLLSSKMNHGLYKDLMSAKDAGQYVTFNDLRSHGISVSFDSHDHLILKAI